MRVGIFVALLVFVSASIFFFLRGSEQVASGQKGVVVTGSKYASDAGVEILRRGGNAVDAAIAAALVLFVTDPANASLAGRSQILLWFQGKFFGLGAATGVPRQAKGLGKGGYETVPVPGNPAAIGELHRRWGTLGMKALAAPAIRLAREGFVPTTAQRLLYRIVDKRGSLSPSLFEIFSPMASGDLVRQPELAQGLEELASLGFWSFYRGETAERFIEDLQAGGSQMDLLDLTSYKLKSPKVHRASFLGFEIFSLGGDTWGHVVHQLFSVWRELSERFNRPASDEERVFRLAWVINQVMSDQPVHPGTLVANRTARFTKQELLHDVYSVQAAGRWTGDTSHLSVIDRKGNAVSWTTSIGPWFGSGVHSESIGSHLAYSYQMKHSRKPKGSDQTEMAPTIVIENGTPRFVIGAAGSERIPTAIFQVLLRVMQDGRSLKEAVAAPRVYAYQGKARVHSDLPRLAIKALRARGYEIELAQRGPRRHLGIVHAAEIKSGRKIGVADPSYSGSAGAE